jgi:hypothetical protein
MEHAHKRLMAISKPSQLIMILIGALIISGCGTTGPDGQKPPQHAKRVKVVTYDARPRPLTQNLDVYDAKLPSKAFKEIASLTCEGAPNEEAAMTQALLYRARLLGADGAIIVPPDRTMEWNGFGGSSRRVFRCKAIVYDAK